MEKDNKYLKEFLEKNKNKNNSYKRIIKLPIREASRKSKAICLILENLPSLEEKNC